MRTIVITITTLLCTLITITCVATIDANMVRTNELKAEIANTLPQAIMITKDFKDSGESPQSLESYIIQEILLQSASKDNLSIDIIKIDTKNGLVDIVVKKEYKWSGIKKDVKVRKTIILEQYKGSSSNSEARATFLVNNDTYRILQGDLGSSIIKPQTPDIKWGTFNGWQEIDDDGNLGPIISDSEWGNMKLLKNTTFVAAISDKNEPTESDIAAFSHKDFSTALLEYDEGNVVSYDDLIDGLTRINQNNGDTVHDCQITSISYNDTANSEISCNTSYGINHLKSDGLYTYRGKLNKGQCAYALLNYKVNFDITDTTYGLYIKKMCLIKINYNSYPKIDASDRWLTLQDVKNTPVTQEKLIETVHAYDDEDGNLSNRLYVTDFSAQSFNTAGTYKITYQVYDNGKKGALKTVNVHIVDMDKGHNGKLFEYGRFIDKNYYPLLNNKIYVDNNGNLRAKYNSDGILCFLDKNNKFVTFEDNGVLKYYTLDSAPACKIENESSGIYTIKPLSKWMTDSSCINSLTQDLLIDENDKDFTPLRTWTFSYDEISNIKKDIIKNGFDEKFYEHYLDSNCVIH